MRDLTRQDLLRGGRSGPPILAVARVVAAPGRHREGAEYLFGALPKQKQRRLAAEPRWRRHDGLCRRRALSHGRTRGIGRKPNHGAVWIDARESSCSKADCFKCAVKQFSSRHRQQGPGATFCFATVSVKNVLVQRVVPLHPTIILLKRPAKTRLNGTANSRPSLYSL